MSDNQSKKPVTPRRSPQDKRGKKPPLPRYKRGPFTYLIIAIAIFTLMMMMNKFTRVEKIRWDVFVDHVENKHIDGVTVRDTEVTGQFNEQYTNSQEGKGKKSFVVYYNPEVHGQWLRELLEDNGLNHDAAAQRIWLILLMQWVLPLLLLVGFFYFMFARNLRGGAGGMLMSFGRSKHRLQGKDRVKVNFEDVAGVEEAKEEVAEIIEFLKNPKKFQRLGGRIPRGVLLIDPPGCGKTLLAKAIAGQADVPFFSISGSDFVEMFVGSEHRACATCSSRPKKILPASSSLTRLTQSDENAAQALLEVDTTNENKH